MNKGFHGFLTGCLVGKKSIGFNRRCNKYRSSAILWVCKNLESNSLVDEKDREMRITILNLTDLTL